MRDIDPTRSEYLTSGYLARSHAKSSVRYDIGSIVGAVAGPLVGGLLGSNGSSKAAKAQAASADYAAQLQKEQFDKTVELNAPFRDAGLTAQNRLMQLYGLGPKFDQSFSNFNAGAYLNSNPDAKAWVDKKSTSGGVNIPGFNMPAGPNTSGKNPEQLAYDHWVADGSRRTGDFWKNQTAPSDYGSAMKDFSAADFQTDPGYAFRQQQGQQGIERSAASRGGLLSGAAAKDAMRFNQGLASDEYTNAFNRFQVNRSNKVNSLQSLMGAGQTAAGQVTNAGQNYATNAGNAAMSAGNARASGYMGQANAWGNALGGVTNGLMQNQLMTKMFPTP